MKRTRTLFVCAAAMLLALSTACNPLEWFVPDKKELTTCDLTWLLTNASDRTVRFQFADFGFHTLPAGQSVELMHTTVRASRVEHSFYALFDYRPESHPLTLYTENGDTPLRTWTLSERHQAGKQFYNREAWIFYRPSDTTAEGTFTLTAEDLE